MTREDYANKLIGMLGGTTATARHFGLNDRRVADMWRKRGVPVQFAQEAAQLLGVGLEKVIYGD